MTVELAEYEGQYQVELTAETIEEATKLLRMASTTKKHPMIETTFFHEEIRAYVNIPRKKEYQRRINNQ